MSELQLTHLTYCGADRPPAQIIFGPELTVIYGTSDTGKSFIVKSIEYMLGGADLAMVPESEGYTQILLGLLMPNGSPLTLLRAPDSNSIFLYYADLRAYVTEMPDASVTAVHNVRSRNSLSIHMLRELGLDEVLIRKNEAGGTRPWLWPICYIWLLSPKTVWSATYPQCCAQGRPIRALRSCR